MLYEANNLHRQIYTDGRGVPKEISLAAYLGYSAGHWEGDTPVVQTVGFNDKTILDLRGHPHSEDLRLVERFHRRDFGHMDVEMTFEDPQMYTKPFTISIPHNLLADEDIFEMYCADNEKDAVHLGNHYDRNSCSGECERHGGVGANLVVHYLRFTSMLGLLPIGLLGERREAWEQGPVKLNSGGVA